MNNKYFYIVLIVTTSSLFCMDQKQNIERKSKEICKSIDLLSDTGPREIQKIIADYAQEYILDRTLNNSANPVCAIKYSSDSRYIAAGSLFNTINIWDTNTGNCIKTLNGHTSQLRCFAYCSSGKYLASLSLNNTIKIWDLINGNCIRTINSPDYLYSIAYSPVVAESSDSQGNKTLLSKGAEPLERVGGQQDQGIIKETSTSKYLAYSSGDTTIKILDLNTGNYAHTLRGHTQQVASIAYSPCGKFIASGSFDQTIKIWDTNSGNCIKTLFDESLKTNGPIDSIAYSHSGKYIASGNAKGFIQIWDLNTDSCIHNYIYSHMAGVSSVEFSFDDKYLASHNAFTKIWDIKTGDCIDTVGIFIDASSITLSPDGKYLASGSYDQKIRIYKNTF